MKAKLTKGNMASLTNPQNNHLISSYFGQSPYGVLIEPSKELTALLDTARETRGLPFTTKLSLITELARSSMRNAYEGMLTGDEATKAKCSSMVMKPHSLTEALQESLGCCRYQATLFFLLALEAELGSKHYLQSAPIGGINTCFNDVYDETGVVHHVSIFTKSLSDQRYNYSTDPQIFERPNDYLPDNPFLAYTKSEDGQCMLYCKQGSHFDAYDKAKATVETLEGYLASLSSMECERKELLIQKCHAAIGLHRAKMEKLGN